MAAQREWYEKDYYKVLGVSEDAAPKDITKAYRKLARGQSPRHPSRRRRGRGAVQGVSAAYDVLGDEAKRKEYDEVRKLGPIGGFQGGGPGGPGGFNFNVGSDGLGDLLGQMFGRGRRGGGPSASAGSAARRRRRGDPQPRLRRRRTGPHHHAAPHQRCAVQHVPRQRCQARHAAEGVLELRRARCHRRQPGPVLVLVAVPRVRRSRCGHHRSVPDMPRHRHRAPRRAKCRRASRPVLPTVRRSGSRAAVRPAATAARRATSSSSATSPRIACSGATATTSRSGCRSRSPRPRSAATSTCRRSTARG